MAEKLSNPFYMLLDKIHYKGHYKTHVWYGHTEKTNLLYTLNNKTTNPQSSPQKTTWKPSTVVRQPPRPPNKGPFTPRPRASAHVLAVPPFAAIDPPPTILSPPAALSANPRRRKRRNGAWPPVGGMGRPNARERSASGLSQSPNSTRASARGL